MFDVVSMCVTEHRPSKLIGGYDLDNPSNQKIKEEMIKILTVLLEQKRNEYMVNNSDLILAYWNGTTGGTKNCVDYATKLNKQILFKKTGLKDA